MRILVALRLLFLSIPKMLSKVLLGTWLPGVDVHPESKRASVDAAVIPAKLSVIPLKLLCNANFSQLFFLSLGSLTLH